MKRSYLTEKCLLWLDRGTKKECQQPERVNTSAAKAAAHFWEKYGTPPAVIYVHPASAAEKFVVVVRKRNIPVVPKRGTLQKHYRVCKEFDPNDQS